MRTMRINTFLLHFSYFVNIHLRLSTWIAEKNRLVHCAKKKEIKKCYNCRRKLIDAIILHFFPQSAHNSNTLDDDDNDKTKEARNEMRNGFDWLCHEWIKKCNCNFNRLYWNSDPVYLILSLLTLFVSHFPHICLFLLIRSPTSSVGVSIVMKRSH